MNKAIIIFGRETIDGFPIESYQLVIGLNYITSCYDGKNNKEEFLESVCSLFATKLIEQSSGVKIEIENGYKIAPESNHLVEIESLESGIITEFYEQLKNKLSKLSGARLTHLADLT